mmetsp:Transcript_116997/g.364265  ORF Transcript_116997/g.364265 Transcript_116997/m.364265 type:complete len:238 (+) Transcript_116997:843-1556(+)
MAVSVQYSCNFCTELFSMSAELISAGFFGKRTSRSSVDSKPMLCRGLTTAEVEKRSIFTMIAEMAVLMSTTVLSAFLSASKWLRPSWSGLFRPSMRRRRAACLLARPCRAARARSLSSTAAVTASRASDMFTCSCCCRSTSTSSTLHCASSRAPSAFRTSRKRSVMAPFIDSICSLKTLRPSHALLQLARLNLALTSSPSFFCRSLIKSLTLLAISPTSSYEIFCAVSLKLWHKGPQ